jgi:D-alanine-D-alanine ligase
VFEPVPLPPRIRLIVLFGGQSAEHDVSRATAAHVLNALDPDRYDVSAIGITRDGQWVNADAAAHAALRSLRTPSLASGSAIETGVDVIGSPTSYHPALAQDADVPTVVLPLLHGPMGEDGTVQGLMELLDVAYVGAGVLGSSVSMDKAMAKVVLASHGIAQAKWRQVMDYEVTTHTAQSLVDELGLPMFVKPANMGSSVGVSKAKTVVEVHDALTAAFVYDRVVVCEEAIVGRELEVAVLGNEHPRASLPGEVMPGSDFYSYEDKYLQDNARYFIPADLKPSETEGLQALAVRVFQALRIEGLARVDFFYEEGGRGFMCNEANTMPGFTPISMYPKMWQASGLSYTDLIDELVGLALARHATRRRATQ